jgi:hypothetical protein
MRENEPSELRTVTLEAVDPDAIAVDVEAGSLPDLLRWCVDTLASSVPEPDKASLVVTGDFVGSVRSRLREGSPAESYGVERGTGIVAGKTMDRGDGTIDVLLPAFFFVADAGDEQRSASARIASRTLVHEAAHVAALQNEQTFDYAGEPGRDGDLQTLAYEILDEYRAEVTVPLEMREGELPLDGLEALDTLAQGLARAAAAYQQHHVVPKLVAEVANAASVAWKQMACMAALERLEPEQSSVTDDVRADSQWQRMAGARWSDFQQSLDRARPGNEVMAAEEIALIVEELTATLLAWLEDLGFIWSEDRFDISSWYFEDEHFQRAFAALP